MQRKLLDDRRGVALLAVTISVILLAISLSVALPRVDHELRREKEIQLRFILGEFRRAIQKYQNHNNTLPTNIDELICDKAGNRFLRRIYDDPITGKTDWACETASGSFVIHSSSEEISLSGVPYSQFR
ncbi:MAG: hypothetical protein Kow0029_18560 [Candidatus Rifleibacteriota bacterium]